MPGSPMVTISAFTRTFMRRKGMSSAYEVFQSKLALVSAAMPSSVALRADGSPASVPLKPSLAMSRMPLTPWEWQSSCSGPRKAAGSAMGVNL